MKDLEKIKSEDLAAQVQDANPANFAIEQEVAQLVGATVPQPTEPSADDARELGAQLLVFLRRALLPIRSALRTAVAAIYAHLDSRCTAYTPAAYASYIPRPYDPMTTPRAPRTLPNLLTALTAFSDRKIGGTDAPDGISLAHLMGDSSARAALSEFTDDNVGWELNTNLPSWMQKGTRLELGCRYATGGITLANGNTDLEEIVLPYFEGLRPDITYWRSTLALASGCPNVTRIYAPKLKTLCTYQFSFAFSGFDYLEELNVPSFEKYLTEYGYGLVGNCPSLKKLCAPKYTYNNGYSGIFKDMPALEEADLSGLTSVAGHNYYGYGGMNNCPELHTLKLGVLTACDSYAFVDDPKLVRLEIAGAVGSINFSGWNPTDALANNLQQFLQNFKDHIALRLTANGSGKTLTLSQAVRDAIHAAEATYGIEAIIVTQKGWTLSPAPTA